MPNAIYPKWKEALLQATANSALTGTVKVALVDTAVYTYSAAHQFLTDPSTARVGTDQTPGSKTYTDGAFDAADPTFPSVTGAIVEAIVFYVDNGVAATSRLVALVYTGVTNLPATPNGGNIGLVLDAADISKLGV